MLIMYVVFMPSRENCHYHSNENSKNVQTSKLKHHLSYLDENRNVN